MIIPSPRIIAVDDEPKHLEGLAQGLNRYGAACLPVHFTGEPIVAPCSHVRVIFADLHLSGGPPGDHAQDFAMIGGLIEETFRPSGPYFVVLWTMYPEQADALFRFLLDRLHNVTKPFSVKALNKNDHLDSQGDVRDPKALVESIGLIAAEQPQIGALFNWEERALGAAADTVSSVTAMATVAAGKADPGVEVGRLLRHLADEAVGSEHVEDDRFRAVNDALMPILADRIATMRLRSEDNEIWQGAFEGREAPTGLASNEASTLNRLLHIAAPTAKDDGSERGAVIALPEEFLGEAFARTFDLATEKVADSQFWRKQSEEDRDQDRWVLVQTQAACDHAQNQPGPLPFHLGLCLLTSSVRKNGTPPSALWRSPLFEFENEARVLHVSARFQVSLSSEKAKLGSPLFRLREQLLNILIYHLHSYGARPGTISFRPQK